MKARKRSTKLECARYVARAPFDEEHSVLVHLVGTREVVVSSRVLQVFDAFSSPKDPHEVAKELDVDTSMIDPIVDTLYDADLLQPERTREAQQIRALYRIRFHNRELEANPRPLVRTSAVSRASPVLAAPEIGEHTTLSLSKSLAVLALEDGEVLVRHPLERCLHLDRALWRISRAFLEPKAIAKVKKRVRGRTTQQESLIEACRFLVRRGVLWDSREREVERLRERFAPAPGDEVDLDVVELNRDDLELKYRPYTLRDMRPIHAIGELAAIGECHVHGQIPALQFLAERAGWDLRIRTIDAPEQLRGTRWSLVLVSLMPHAFELYEALGTGDLDRARALLPGVAATCDARIDALRHQTESAILVHSFGRPTFSAPSHFSPMSHETSALLVELNRRLLAAVERHRDILLLDEDAIVRRHAVGSHWNDTFQASWHHAANTLWGAPPHEGIDYERAGAVPPRASWQGNPAFPFARAYLDALEALHESRPVRLVVFEPNELLWPGKLEDRAEARPRGGWLTAPHVFYSGVNEALLAIARRGIALACVSSCPREALIERWERAPGDAAVKPSDVVFIRGGEAREEMLARVLAESGCAEEDTLFIDLSNPAPRKFRGRVFTGDRWSLRRYLLTAPELSIEARRSNVSTEQTTRAEPVNVAIEAAPREARDPVEIGAQVTAVLAAHLGASPAQIEAVDDLRLFGVDSIAAMELVAAIESEIGARIAERDIAPSVVFKRS